SSDPLLRPNPRPARPLRVGRLPARLRRIPRQVRGRVRHLAAPGSGRRAIPGIRTVLGAPSPSHAVAALVLPLAVPVGTQFTEDTGTMPGRLRPADRRVWAERNAEGNGDIVDCRGK